MSTLQFSGNTRIWRSFEISLISNKIGSQSTRISPKFPFSRSAIHSAVLHTSKAVPFSRHKKTYNHGRITPTLASSSSTSADTTSNDDEVRQLVNSLLLAFLAMQNKSLFAAKCLIETVIALYCRGYSMDDVQLTATLSTLSTTDRFKPMMMDILFAWTAVVMMVLRVVGVPLLPEGEARREKKKVENYESMPQEDRMTQDLEFFVKGCLDRFLSGMDLFRLQLQQGMQGAVEGEPEASGMSPTVEVLQQNTRLAIITLEVVRDLGLETKVVLERNYSESMEGASGSDDDEEEEKDEEKESPSSSSVSGSINYRPVLLGYLDGILDASKAPSPEVVGENRSVAVRGAAVRLLIAFNGASSGYLRSARSFVDQVYICYAAGWTAEELFAALKDEEFAQSGGVTRFNLVNSPGGKHIFASLFARWISLSYMALAQLGISHPGAEEQVGWAWVGSMSAGSAGVTGGLEAHAMADFVGATLRNAAESDDENGGAEVARGEGGRRRAMIDGGAAAASVDMDSVAVDDGRRHEGFTAGFEDPSLLQTSSFALILSQEISLIRLTRLVMLQRRGYETGGGGHSGGGDGGGGGVSASATA